MSTGSDRPRGRGWWLIAKIAISVLLLVILRSRIDLGETAREIGRASPFGLLAAAGIFLCSNLLGAVQWRQILRAFGLDIGLLRVVAYYMQGLFFGLFLPANVGGDVSRVYDTTRRTGELQASVAATLLDRLVGFWSLSMMAVGSLALYGDRTPPAAVLAPILAFAALNVGVAGVVVSRRVRRLVSRLLGGLPRVGEPLVSVLDTLGRVGKRPRLLFGVLALSMVVQVLRVVVHFVVALSMGIEIPLRDFFVIIPVLAVLVALPISFGGIGVRESAAVPLFGAVGVTPAAAVGMQVATFLVSILVNLPGWFIFLLRQVRGSSRSTPLGREVDVEKS